MSATIIMFPGTALHGGTLMPDDAGSIAPRVPVSVGAPLCVKPGSIAPQFPPLSATALATKFADHFLPICQASVDLLEADEADFEDRCRRVLDGDGMAMIDELCVEMAIVSRQMQVLVDGLELTRARLRTAVARPAPTYPEIPGAC